MARAAESPSLEYECPTCSFRLWLPITELGVGILGLYDDARFPGRCLLVLRQHEEDFTSIPAQLASDFMLEAQLAARAIKIAVKADRVNLAILGNREPHLHVHLIPRIRTNDPVPLQSPWAHPGKKEPLSPAHRVTIVESIIRSLEDEGNSPNSPPRR